MNRREFILRSTLATPVLALVPGCAGTGGGTAWLAVASALAEQASYIGVSMRLATHPEDRQKFELAAQALASLDRSGNYNPNTLAATIAALPVDWNGTLIISGIVSVWDATSGTLIDVSKAPGVQAILQAVEWGINRALAEAPAATTRTSTAASPVRTMTTPVVPKRRVKI